MMGRKKAFTLLEILVALSISSFILMALSQMYRNAAQFLDKSTARMRENRKISLLFNQMERDISSAFIPTLAKEITPAHEKQEEGAKEPPKKMTPEERRAKKQEELSALKNFFLASKQDNSFENVDFDEHKLLPFERLTFICTNPLLMHGAHLPRLVRVAYELVKDKAKSTQDIISYQLIRKESFDLEDPAMKVNAFDYARVARQAVREQVIIDEVKNLYVEYIGFKEKEESEEMAEDEEVLPDKKEEFRTFSWGDKPYTHGVVPQGVEVTILLWDQQNKGYTTFHTMIPIFSFPSSHAKEIQKTLEKEAEHKPSTPLAAKGVAS